MGKLIAGEAGARDGIHTFEAWLEAEVGVQSLFHQMRKIVRNSVVMALTKVFKPGTFDCLKLRARAGLLQRPYHLMMVGGDDVLIVCRADSALPLAAEFARALKQQCGQSASFKLRPLTAGIGVMISPASLPFAALHQAAEQLAASAKSWWRGMPIDGQGSVVDWAVTSSAWVDDPLGDRRQDQLVAGNRPLWLSARPCRILSPEPVPGPPGAPEPAGPSLEQHLSAAAQLEVALFSNGRDDQAQVARSQLKELPERLRQGRNLGTLAWRELPTGARDLLTQAGYGTPTSPWREQGKAFISDLPDLVEVFEIARLGASSSHGALRPTR